MASPSNLLKPLGMITTRELLEWLLYKTLQKTKELEIQLR